MSKILLLNSKEVAKVRKEIPELHDKKLLASGMFSGVYEGSTPSTVYKLTICPQSYHLLLDSAVGQSIHAPKLKRDFGMVGEFLTGTNVVETKLTKPIKKLVPMYLVEVERLEKLSRDNKKIAKRIHEKIKETIYNVTCADDDEESRLFPHIAKALISVGHELRFAGFGEHYAAYFEALTDYMQRTGHESFFDMHVQNFMQRADGTLVFSDPIGTKDVFKTKGTFSRLRDHTSDIDWSAVREDHKQRFGHLLKKEKGAA